MTLSVKVKVLAAGCHHPVDAPTRFLVVIQFSRAIQDLNLVTPSVFVGSATGANRLGEC